MKKDKGIPGYREKQPMKTEEPTQSEEPREEAKEVQKMGVQEKSQVSKIFIYQLIYYIFINNYFAKIRLQTCSNIVKRL